MKHSICLTIFFFTSLLHSQDTAEISLLETDDTWRKETLSFPIPFAPGIDLEGDADVRFSKGWADSESPLFWTYTFAWDLSIEEKLSEGSLEEIMEEYFDGLMNVVKKDKEQQLPKTVALFIQSEATEDHHEYRGKVSIYDAFFSEEIVVLNVLVHHRYCNITDRHIYFFKLSPQPLHHRIWSEVHGVKTRSGICG